MHHPTPLGGASPPHTCFLMPGAQSNEKRILYFPQMNVPYKYL